jgi:uncharacterized protein
MIEPMLPPNEVIARTVQHVKETLADDSSGHDWFHIERVWRMARRLAEEEGADLFVVELAALLHDIADWKFHGGDETAGPRVAGEWLEDLSVARETREHVCEIIAHISFKGAGVKDGMATLEGQVVQDADRLDALGAIGIARTFAYGAHKGQPLYDPNVQPVLHESFAAYKSNKGNTLNHFYEKLLLLKDRLNTRSARKLAEGRHAFMEEFVARFLAEWNGEERERGV